jgi:hypothetical protein
MNNNDHLKQTSNRLEPFSFTVYLLRSERQSFFVNITFLAIVAVYNILFEVGLGVTTKKTENFFSNNIYSHNIFLSGGVIARIKISFLFNVLTQL